MEEPDKTAVYSFTEDDFRFDFLFSPRKGAKRLFVLFSGDALRAKNDPPVFQRWTWAPHFPGHCLYISDPSLHLASDLGLAWYAGTSGCDPLPTIKRVITEIAHQLNVAVRDVWSYGSSGGGFAALRLGCQLPGIGVVAINPQTVVTNYAGGSLKRYLRYCFDGRDRTKALADFPERLSLLAQVEPLKKTRVIYIQNTTDTHHFQEHYLPFCEAMGVGPEHNETETDFRRLLFAHDGGHKKAENPEVFDKALDIIESYSNRKAGIAAPAR